MKHLIYLFISLSASLPAYGQVVAIQNELQNVLYLGMDNPLTIAVEGYASGAIFVTCASAAIKGEHGHYFITPTAAGIISVAVKRKTAKGIKTIREMPFLVKSLTITASLHGKKSGYLFVAEARQQIGPAAKIDCDWGCIDAVVRIDSCTVMILRNSKPVFIKSLHNHKGIRFADDEDIHNAIQTLKDGDKLLLTDITCYTFDTISRHLPPMEFTIKDE